MNSAVRSAPRLLKTGPMTANVRWLTVWLVLAGCASGDLEITSSSGGASGSGAGRTGGRTGNIGAPGAPDPGFSVPPPSSGTIDDGEGSCAAETQVPRTAALDLFVLLDQSGSMTEDDDRWTPVTRALLGFVADPRVAGVGIGLQYFPLGAAKVMDPVICEPATYATPAVQIASLPDNAAAFRRSIESHAFTKAEARDPAHWGTPTLPAVQGALGYLRQRAAAQPDRRVALLLATDGQPSSFCAGNNIPGIAAVLAAAAAEPLPLNTYVIGIGRVDRLNELAMAGGTGSAAFIVETGNNQTEKQFIAALDAIRRLALPCTYEIPTSGAGPIDPQKVNVRIGGAGVVGQVANAAACPPDRPAWHYDAPMAPKQIVMCPSACEHLRTRAENIELLYGCKTVVVE